MTFPSYSLKLIISIYLSIYLSNVIFSAHKSAFVLLPLLSLQSEYYTFENIFNTLPILRHLFYTCTNNQQPKLFHHIFNCPFLYVPVYTVTVTQAVWMRISGDLIQRNLPTVFVYVYLYSDYINPFLLETLKGVLAKNIASEIS